MAGLNSTPVAGGGGGGHGRRRKLVFTARGPWEAAMSADTTAGTVSKANGGVGRTFGHFLSWNIRRMLDEHADVDVYCMEGKFRVHRLVLSAMSPFLANLFGREHRCCHQLPSELLLPWVSFDVFKALLDFIYTGQSTVKKENVADVLSVGNILGLKGISQVVETSRLQEHSFKPRPYPLSSSPTAQSTAPEIEKVEAPKKVVKSETESERKPPLESCHPHQGPFSNFKHLFHPHLKNPATPSQVQSGFRRIQPAVLGLSEFRAAKNREEQQQRLRKEAVSAGDGKQEKPKPLMQQRPFAPTVTQAGNFPREERPSNVTQTYVSQEGPLTKPEASCTEVHKRPLAVTQDVRMQDGLTARYDRHPEKTQIPHGRPMPFVGEAEIHRHPWIAPAPKSCPPVSISITPYPKTVQAASRPTQSDHVASVQTNESKVFYGPITDHPNKVATASRLDPPPRQFYLDRDAPMPTNLPTHSVSSSHPSHLERALVFAPEEGWQHGRGTWLQNSQPYAVQRREIHLPSTSAASTAPSQQRQGRRKPRKRQGRQQDRRSAGADGARGGGYNHGKRHHHAKVSRNESRSIWEPPRRGSEVHQMVNSSGDNALTQMMPVLPSQMAFPHQNLQHQATVFEQHHYRQTAAPQTYRNPEVPCVVERTPTLSIQDEVATASTAPRGDDVNFAHAIPNYDLLAQFERFVKQQRQEGGDPNNNRSAGDGEVLEFALS